MIIQLSAVFIGLKKFIQSNEFIIFFSRMSRSALWRQEGARKMREKEAEELFAFALNEGRVSSGRFFFSLFFFVHWT